MVVKDGIRYREEHVPADTEETKAQPVEDGAEVQHKMRTPRKTAVRKPASE